MTRSGLVGTLVYIWSHNANNTKRKTNKKIYCEMKNIFVSLFENLLYMIYVFIGPCFCLCDVVSYAPSHSAPDMLVLKKRWTKLLIEITRGKSLALKYFLFGILTSNANIEFHHLGTLCGAIFSIRPYIFSDLNRLKSLLWKLWKKMIFMKKFNNIMTKNQSLLCGE